MINTYEISLLDKNAIYHSNIVITNKSPVDTALWYKEHKPNKSVIGIHVATEDSFKPGKPIIRI